MKQYFLSVCAASILCCLWYTLTPNGAAKTRSRYMGSLVLMLVILSPLVTIDPDFLDRSLTQFDMEANTWKQAAHFQSDQLMKELIQTKCSEYILEQIPPEEQADLQFEFSFHEQDGIPIPYTVVVTGRCSNLVKQLLEASLSKDLNIPLQRQVWQTQ